MKCPFATWIPVQNHGGNMTAHLGLVLHVQVGNGSLAGYFNNPASGVSAHFWASKTGQLEQYVDTDSIAWAQVAGNPNYLSVETEGYPNEPLTEPQMQIVADLLLWSSETYNFPIVGPVAHGNKGFTQHCNLNGTPDPAWGDHTCPDPLRMGQMGDIIALTIPRKEDMLVAFTSTGEGYWIVKSDGSVWAYGDAQYKNGINNSGPNGGSALVAGDVPTSISGKGIDGYLISTMKGNLYAFGSAPFLGNK
jgi:hypothetical protein